MKIKKVYSIFFSPTGTTRKATEAFARGTGIPCESIDLTLPESRRTFLRSFDNDDLAIIGLPVYGGRLPKDLEDFFAGMNHYTVDYIVNYIT